VRLEKEGIMFAAGPNWTDDEKSWEGDGMLVIRLILSPMRKK
jgi:hypothetical protein